MAASPISSSAILFFTKASARFSIMQATRIMRAPFTGAVPASGIQPRWRGVQHPSGSGCSKSGIATPWITITASAAPGRRRGSLLSRGRWAHDSRDVSDRRFASNIDEVRQIAIAHGRNRIIAGFEARARLFKTTAAQPIKRRFYPLYSLVRRTINRSYRQVS